jgi:hypothetical protein
VIAAGLIVGSIVGGGESEPPAAVVIQIAAAPGAAGGEAAKVSASAETPALPAVPDPALIEESPLGPLPRIADDGRMARLVYARSFDRRDDRPRIALIVVDLGLAAAATEAAIDRLPAAVTLALSSYGRHLAEWARRGRGAGHEILLGLPLETSDFPVRDPGPAALLTGLDATANVQRLEAVLARSSGYVGVISVGETRLEEREESLRPVLTAVRDRGLLYVDGARSKTELVDRLAGEIDLPRVLVDLVIDGEPTAAAIDDALLRLEIISRERSVAVGLVRPYPVSLARIDAWAGGLAERNLVLAPVSAVADRQLLQ